MKEGETGMNGGKREEGRGREGGREEGGRGRRDGGRGNVNRFNVTNKPLNAMLNI